jgi:hypothetical protein
MTSSKTWLLAIGALILVLCAAGGYVYYRISYGPGALSAAQTARNAAKAQAHQYQQDAINIQMNSEERPDYAKAVDLLNKALAINPTTQSKTQEGYLKVQLALNEHLVNESSHLKSSAHGLEVSEWVSIPVLHSLEEVATDTSYGPGPRSDAYYEMADLLLNHLNKEAAEESLNEVFEGPLAPLATTGNVYVAIAGLYDLSSQLSADLSDDTAYGLLPTIIASYKTADMNLEQNLMHSDVSKDTRAGNYERAVDRIANGDRTYAEFASIIDQVSPEKRAARRGDEYRNTAYAARARAEAEGKLYLLDPSGSGVKPADVDQGFEAALSFSEKSDALTVRRMEMRVRFEYAHWLAEAYGRSADERIRTVLAPLYADIEAASGIWVHAKNQVGLMSFDTYESRGFIMLAAADPQFKKLVLENGWTEALLATPTPSFVVRS